MKLSSSQTLKQIASLINAKFIGDANFPVTGINEIHMVAAGDLTFVDHPKYYNKALNSAATTILINKDVECPEGKALILSDDPFRDYNFLTRHFNPSVYNNSLIAPSAKIGEGTWMAANVFIGNNVVVGKNCKLHSGVVVYDNCILGDDVIIHSNTVIGADAFYYKRRPEGYDKMHTCGRVVIGNKVEIGALCSIDKGVSGDTKIGDGTKMDNHIHIGHDTTIGKNCLFAAFVAISGVTTVEDDVIIWGQAGINKDLVIGKGAVVLAQSGLGENIPPGKTYFGSPAGEAREKMKELSWIKRIPEMWERMKEKNN